MELFMMKTKMCFQFMILSWMLLKKWGLWTVVIAALTPIPFSIVCWFAGIYKMPYRPFFIGTLVRFLRFALFYYLFVIGWTSA